MEVSFVSLLSCNQLGWWEEQWRGGHSTPPHPPWVIRSWEWSEMSSEEEDTPPPPCPPLVIRSWELSEMSSEEEDTPPTLGHQELRVKWDEQWGGGHPTPPQPPLVIRSWELSKLSNEEDTPPTLGHQELRIKWDELVHILKKKKLQCWHTETLGVWLVIVSTTVMVSWHCDWHHCFVAPKQEQLSVDNLLPNFAMWHDFQNHSIMATLLPQVSLQVLPETKVAINW